MEYIRVTKDNLEKENICCAISNNKDVQVSSTSKVTVTQKGNKFTVKWKKSISADGYYIYASYCGKKATKPAKTVKVGKTAKRRIRIL